MELVPLDIVRVVYLAEIGDRVRLTSLSLLSLLVVLEPSRIILVDLQVSAACVASDVLAPRVLIEKVLPCHAGRCL